jgi:phosphoribosylformimino-5-aminoimidazole carboxamide ribotide isomerase
MELIPAIDLRGGRVVRLEQGDFGRETVYDADPAGAASRLIASGAPRLHVVDLDAAREGSAANRVSIRSILGVAKEVPVQVGGGVRSVAVIEELLDLGVDRVIVGTAALETPEMLEDGASLYPDRVILGLDARDGRVATRGWVETLAVTVLEVARRFETLPLAGVLHTDIHRDGMGVGPNVEATAELARATPHPVIASGGIGSVADVVALARTRVIAAAVIGKALYTGRVDLRDALREVEAC